MTLLLEKARPSLRVYLALCALASLRPEQAQGLSWDHIHFDRGDHGEIKVPVGGDGMRGERIVPLRPNLRARRVEGRENQRFGTMFSSRQQRREAYEALRVEDHTLPEDWPQDDLCHGYHG